MLVNRSPPTLYCPLPAGQPSGAVIVGTETPGWTVRVNLGEGVSVEFRRGPPRSRDFKRGQKGGSFLLRTHVL